MILLFLLALLWASTDVSADCVRGSYTAVKCSKTLSTPEEFFAFSNNKAFKPPTEPTGQVLVGPGSKLLLDFRNPAKSEVWYFDTVEYASHSYLISRLGMTAEYNVNPNLWFRCDWQTYIDVDGSVIYAMTINPGFPVSPTRMIEVCEGVKSTLHLIKTHRVAYVSLDVSVQKYNDEVVSRCNAVGIEVMYVDDLFAKGFQSYQPLYVGEAWGYLKPFPADNNLLAATDIPVFNVLPLDLSVVAGVITSVFQTVNSHVNLKSNERDTPNMILLNYDQIPCISNYTDKPIHLTAAAHGWNIAETTPEIIKQKLTEKLSTRRWINLYHDTLDKILSFDEMCTTEDPNECIKRKKTFGTKASNLAFLLNDNVIGKAATPGTVSARYGYDLTPIGFGIPFQFFVDFVNYPPNHKIKELILYLSNLEMTTENVPPETRVNMSLSLRTLFWNAEIPPHVTKAIYEACDRLFTPKGIDDLKFRSSSNAEDLAGFDGAGLYDSFSVKLGKTYNSTSCVYDRENDEMIPPSVECALKGVYGSLFNQRAIEERSFAKYNHQSCVMGVAVIPRYKELGKVSGNSVGISKLMDGNWKPGYTFSIQEGDNDVTNPDPGTISETSAAIFSVNYRNYTWKTERFATPVAGQPGLNRTVLPLKTMDQMLDIVIRAEEAYCKYHWKLGEKCANISLWNTKVAVDVEFKFFNNSRVHIKQLREFSGKPQKKQDLVITSKCSWINPAYFAPPNGEEGLVNVALNKVAKSSSSTLSGYAYKGNDGNVDGNYYTSVYVNKQSNNVHWWEVELGDSYDVRYLRLHPNVNYPSTMADFTYQLFSDSGASTNVRVQVSGGPRKPHVTPVNVPGGVRRVRILQNLSLNSAPSIAFAELQVFATPIIIGDQDDFPVEPRPNSEDCTWGNWTDWSVCTKACAGGTQFRTRKGLPSGKYEDTCTNYDVQSNREERTCNTQFCPIDCKWISQWTAWSKCEPCGRTTVQVRTREKQAPLYGGKDCEGDALDTFECFQKCGTTPLVPAILCWTRSHKQKKWTTYVKITNKGQVIYELSNANNNLLINDKTHIMTFTQTVGQNDWVILPIANDEMDGSISWSLEGKPLSLSTDQPNYKDLRCPSVISLSFDLTVDPCNENLANDTLAIIAQKLIEKGMFDVQLTGELKIKTKCSAKRSTEQTTSDATFKLTLSNPSSMEADDMIYEAFDAAYLLQPIAQEAFTNQGMQMAPSNNPNIDTTGIKPVLSPADMPPPPPPPTNPTPPPTITPTTSGDVPTGTPTVSNNSTNDNQKGNSAAAQPWYLWVGIVAGLIAVVLLVVVVVYLIRRGTVSERV